MTEPLEVGQAHHSTMDGLAETQPVVPRVPNRRGRPVLPDETAKRAIVHARVPRQLKERLEAQAESEGISVSAYVARLLERATGMHPETD